jgi:hypothetical protein
MQKKNSQAQTASQLSSHKVDGSLLPKINIAEAMPQGIENGGINCGFGGG